MKRVFARWAEVTHHSAGYYGVRRTLLYLLRRSCGLVFGDGADNAVHELWSRYQACCSGVMEGATVLDVGCGPGEHSDEVLKLWNAAWYVGVDLSVGMVRDAKLRYPAGNFIAADGCLLSFLNGSLDVVTSSFTFHHLPLAVRTKFLQEQLRVGKIVLLRDLFGMEPGWRGWLYGIYYMIFDGSEYRFTLQEWRQFFVSAGAEIVIEGYSGQDFVRNRHCFFLIRKTPNRNLLDNI